MAATAKMIKTYRRDEDETLLFWEAWVDGGGIAVHRGKVGAKGKKSFRTARGSALYRRDNPTVTEHMKLFAEETADAGYRQVPGDEHGWVVLQCWMFSPDLSDPRDARLFDEGQDALNEYLGWRGVGHYDGNDWGGKPPADYGLDTVVFNLFCRVVDTALGVKVVRGFAREFGIEQLHVVGAREPGEDSDYVLAWSPRARDTKLDIF